MWATLSASNLCCDWLFPGNPPSKPNKKTIKQRFLKLLPCCRSSSSSSVNQSKCQDTRVHHHSESSSHEFSHGENETLIVSLTFPLLYFRHCFSGKGFSCSLRCISGSDYFIPLSIPPRRKYIRWCWTDDSVLQTGGARPPRSADQLQQERAAGPLPGIQKRQSKTPLNVPFVYFFFNSWMTL